MIDTLNKSRHFGELRRPPYRVANVCERVVSKRS